MAEQTIFDDVLYREWVDSLNDIPIYDVIEAFDIERKGDSILCPNPEHHDQNFGNCRLYKNRYYCFACHDSGDNIHFVMKITGQKYMSAANLLATRMGYPIYHPRLKSGERTDKEKMPVTKSQLKLLGLIPKKQVFLSEAFDLYKPVQGEYRGDFFGYITGSTETMGMEKLFEEDKEAFFSVIAGKFREMSTIYLELYAAKIWQWNIFNDQQTIQTVLEYSLDELNKLAVLFTENRIMDLSYFHLPPFEKKKPKYVLTI